MTNSSDTRLDEQTRNMLIELVKGRHLLYTDTGALSLADLRDERQKLWDEVAEKINLPAEVCKIKFTNLKNNYFKNLRNDSISDEMRRRLDFLDDQAPWNRTERPARITNRRATKRARTIDHNEDGDPILVNTSTTSVPQDATNHANAVSNGHSSKSHPQITPNSSRLLKSSANDESIINIDQYQNGVNGSTAEKPQSSYGGKEDDLTSFYRNMEHTTRKFDARLQVKVKRMISDIIYDAEEQWINNGQAK